MAQTIVVQGLRAKENTEEQIALRRVRNLIRHTELELPGSRGFGLKKDYLDEPPEEMKTDFAADLYDKIDRYVPDVDIRDIQWESSDPESGNNKATVILERRES